MNPRLEANNVWSDIPMWSYLQRQELKQNSDSRHRTSPLQKIPVIGNIHHPLIPVMHLE